MSQVPISLPPQQCAGLRNQYVLPAQVLVVSEPTRFTTILGSCVAVCLYDTDRGVAGINHFLLPGMPQRSDEPEPLRWGVPAIDDLLKRVLAAGGRRAFLQAKVFGGAQIGSGDVPASLRIGDRNIDTALAELARHLVPVMNQFLGGQAGLKLIFESHTGMAWARKLGEGPALAAAAPAPRQWH